MRLSRVVAPGVVFAVPVLASALAWLVPGASLNLRGFDVRSSPSLLAVVVLAVWYLLCFGAIQFGVKTGLAVRPARLLYAVERDPRFERRLYLVLTILATVGVLSALRTAVSTVSIIDALSSSTGNELTQSLGRSAGLDTLRYTGAVSAPIGFYLWRHGRAGLSMACWNGLLLVGNALFSSRLSLVMALVIYATLLARLTPSARLRGRWLAVVMIVGFTALAILNYLRNANFYRDGGVTNPAVMNVYQILTYLGSPFQVCLGIVDPMLSGVYPSRSNFLAASQIVVPTFLGANRDPLVQGSDRFASRVSIADNLTTNSTFADTYDQLGWWGLFWVLVGLTVAGIVYGTIVQYRSVFVAATGVVLYGFAESWRLYLFNQGIAVYLVLVTVAAAVIAAVSLSLSGRRADHATVTSGPASDP